MATFRSDFFKISEDTELIKTSDDRHKYVMRNFKKVSAKMYDHKCDIKLQVGKDTFRAHKDVLSEASDYFSAMFSHNMREKEQDAIEIHGISGAGFTPMMEYFYHGHVTVDPDNIEDILEAARFFHIEWMIKICCDFLVRHLCIENYDNVLILADKYCLGDLRYDIFMFVGQNFIALAKRPKFMLLSYDLFHMILENDYFIDAPESYIFQTVLKWLEHDDSREEYRVDMLTLIRYPLFEPEELEGIPSNLEEIEEIKTLLEEARAYHANSAAQCVMASENSQPRGGRDVLFTFQAVEDASLLQYKIPGMHDVYTQEMDTTFMDSVFEFSASAVLGNFLFIIGGYNRSNWSSARDMYRYDPRHMSWLQLTPMQCPRVSFVLCASDQGLYAITGINHVVEDLHDREDILDSVEFYNPHTNSWRSAPNLPLGCFSASAAWAAGRLFVTGGISANFEDSIPVSYLHMHTPGDEDWSRKSPMLCERHSHCMVPFENKIFVFGGYTSVGDMVSFDMCLRNEVYDIETDQWSEISQTPADVGKVHNSGTVLNGKIYILGGKREDRYLLEFDLESMDFGLGEFCGQHSQKLGVLRVSLPDQESRDTLEEGQEEVP